MLTSRLQNSYKNRKLLIALLLCALVLSLLLELFVFTAERRTAFDAEPLSVYGSDTVQLVPHNYTVSDHRYTPRATDPQLIFAGINAPVKTVVLRFAEPLDVKTPVETFYSTASFDFKQQNSVRRQTMPSGTTEYIISLPDGATYTDIRLDIDGEFVLADILVSTGDYHHRVDFFTRAFSVARPVLCFLFLLGAIAFVLFGLLRDRGERGLSAWEWVLLGLLFVFYTAWATEQPLNYAPDETMRYEVTQFIFEHGRLPVYDELLSPWGFSYAHSPTVLCNQLGAILMKLVSPFASDARSLLVAARMVSVICATLSVYFVIKCCKLLFARAEVRYTVVFLVAFMPQFVFLSSYVNNDIVAFLGVTAIAYAWLLGWKCGWKMRYALLLAFGIAVCALSYYNSYAWILLSVFFCIFSYLAAKPKDRKGLLKLVGVVAGVVVLLVGYSFIRHVVLYGDLLGFQTGSYYGEKYAIDALKPSNRITLAEDGVSLWKMLFGSYGWVLTTVASFIAGFGPMAYFSTPGFYAFVILLLLVGLGGTVARFIGSLRQGKKPSATTLAFYLSLLLCALITVGLSIYNSYTNDFQAQGRYCYPAFLPLAIFCGKGYEFLLERFPKKEHRYLLCGILCTLFVCINLFTYATLYLPT